MDRTQEFSTLVLEKLCSRIDETSEKEGPKQLTAHAWTQSNVKDKYNQKAYRIVTTNPPCLTF